METPQGDPGSTDLQVLATDLDGTLIPLQGNQENRADLQVLAGQLKQHGISLIYITGRHFSSACQAIEEFQLPEPGWLVCDVGTSIFERFESGQFVPAGDYQAHQERLIATFPMDLLRRRLMSVAGMRLQEAEKQGRFKLSFYAEASELDSLVAQIQRVLEEDRAPYAIIQSVDPFNGDGLIDLLPAGVSKAHALKWWVTHAGLSPDNVVFAGDSGNDLDALTAGYRAIVVGNADRSIARRAEESHVESGWRDRLCLAERPATSGVLEGCRWFGLAE